MRKFQLILAYYTLFASGGLFLWSIFLAPKPVGFLIAVATKVGSNFQYEVPEQQCLDYYRGTPGMEQGIKNRLEKVNPDTREHVHINL